MDFEIDYVSAIVDDATLSARSNLWLLKSLFDFSAIDFDPRLTNRLKLLTSCLDDVKFDITTLIESHVLSQPNCMLKRSFGSLILWLYEYLDSRPIQMTQNGVFITELNSKILSQIKIYSTVFGSIYYKTNTTTTFYCRIRFSQFQSQRLDHLLEFHQLIDQHKRENGK